MPEITLLSQETIDKIAAGEVVERPSSVVKELVENAIDAQATAITVEIKEGGISLIRITDNGCGIAHEQVPLAFLRHSTSKIRSAEDLLSVRSLGFRGEALSSIAAVSQVELITKEVSAVTGTRYVVEGSKEKEYEEIGAPDGTTFLVRNLFYNVPARRKFLKTAQTEGGYIADLVERLALSHPNVSFKFISNGQTKLHTSGSSNEKDMIYHIYGRDITAALIPIDTGTELFSIRGFLGKPVISRGNRNYENYFVNGRYIRSSLIAKAIEEAYKGLIMQRQYPFCVLYVTVDAALLDVNVHPTKMELRFSDNEAFYRSLYDVLRKTLTHREYIPEVPAGEEKKQSRPPVSPQAPEPFEQRRIQNLRSAVAADSPYEPRYSQSEPSNLNVFEKLLARSEPAPAGQTQKADAVREAGSYKAKELPGGQQELPGGQQELPGGQQELFHTESGFLTPEAVKKRRIIGQLFDTYWLIEYGDKLFIVDQHAAHEKVLYERTMERVKNRRFDSQNISPPAVLTLSPQEQETLERCREQIEQFGYEIEPFGGREYAVTAAPADFESIDKGSMLLELLDDLAGFGQERTPELILEKIASMSCKAAVKGGNRLSRQEAEHLLNELLDLEDPYHCPHGRPTIISMSRYEIEKKFKRII